MSKKEDPRSIRSRKMFKEAVLALLIEEGSISRLTVQKIADRAELNRATFYLHYEDINDLLRQTTRELFDEISKKLQDLIQTDVMENREQLILFLDYIYENRKYFAVLFEEKSFEMHLYKLLKKFIESRRHAKSEPLPENYVSSEIRAASLMGIIMWWLKDGIHYSAEYIADQIHLMHRR